MADKCLYKYQNGLFVLIKPCGNMLGRDECMYPVPAPHSFTGITFHNDDILEVDCVGVTGNTNATTHIPTPNPEKRQARVLQQGAGGGVFHLEIVGGVPKVVT